MCAYSHQSVRSQVAGLVFFLAVASGLGTVEGGFTDKMTSTQHSITGRTIIGASLVDYA